MLSQLGIVTLHSLNVSATQLKLHYGFSTGKKVICSGMTQASACLQHMYYVHG